MIGKETTGLINVSKKIWKSLGERPTLDVKYQKDVMVNEVSGESKEFNRLESISVIYTDTDDRIKKLQIVID